MNCHKCQEEIGVIESPVTTNGTYATTKSGSCQVSWRESAGVNQPAVIAGSELCEKCYKKRLSTVWRCACCGQEYDDNEGYSEINGGEGGYRCERCSDAAGIALDNRAN